MLTLSEIEKKFPDDKGQVTLEYLHEISQIMWFRRLNKLSNFIFHRSKVITSVIEVLYNHTKEESWYKRLDKFTPFSLVDGKTIEKSRYVEMIDTFNDTGVMDAPLLLHLLGQESQLPADVSIEILRTFHLVHLCGSNAAIGNQKYIVPYFASRTITAPEVYDQLVPLKVDLHLRGLPIPSYIFSLITAVYLDMNSNPSNFPEAGGNGAPVTKSNGIIEHLLHNAGEKRVTLITLTPQKSLCEAREEQISTLRKLTTELKSVWKGVRYESVFYCSHCLLTIKLDPQTAVDPDWYQEEVPDSSREKAPSYTGYEKFVCRKEVQNKENRLVPQPLMKPCM
jgi:hypothetical protein